MIPYGSQWITTFQVGLDLPIEEIGEQIESQSYRDSLPTMQPIRKTAVNKQSKIGNISKPISGLHELFFLFPDLFPDGF
jgi:hypothetical protein